MALTPSITRNSSSRRSPGSFEPRPPQCMASRRTWRSATWTSQSTPGLPPRSLIRYCGPSDQYGGRPLLRQMRVVRWGMSLSDAQWARIEPLLPDRTPRRGGRWRDHRQVIDAIAFKYRTGIPWVDLPERFGSWKGVHNRLRKWAADGTWKRVFTNLLAQADAQGDLDWVVAVDSTVVRAHQHAAGARKKGP